MNDFDFEDYLARYEMASQNKEENEFFAEHPVPEIWRERFEGAQRTLRRLSNFWKQTTQGSVDLVSIPKDVFERFELNRFEIHAELGRGGFGVVYHAWDTVLEREVALKVPRIESFADPHLQRRVSQEAKLAASLNHQYIVPIFEAIPYGVYCCVVSAYCTGGNLAEYTAKNKLSFQEIAELATYLAEALDYCHRKGVVHRDLKPANIMLKEEPCGKLPFTPQLVDFGLAKPFSLSGLTNSSSIFIGTPEYMAPEQVDKHFGPIGPQTDIYGFGCILYELLTGSPPYAGKSLVEVIDLIRSEYTPIILESNTNVDPDLLTICLTCLHKRSGDRYESAAELAEDLRRYGRGEPIRAKQLSWPYRGLIWCQQTQRFRDSGMVVIAANVAMIGSMTLTVLMSAMYIIPRPQASFPIAPFFFAIISMILTHMPLIYVGWKIIQMRLWAIIVSAVSGVILAAFFFTFVFDLLPSRELYWMDIPGFRVIYSAHSILMVFQCLASGVAAIAWKERKRRLAVVDQS